MCVCACMCVFIQNTCHINLLQTTRHKTFKKNIINLSHMKEDRHTHTHTHTHTHKQKHKFYAKFIGFTPNADNFFTRLVTE